MKNGNQLKRGEMVQIWDHQDPKRPFRSLGHGQIGYLVQRHDIVGHSGYIWDVICFGEDPPLKYKVHESWLILINKSSDIKKNA